MGETLEVAEARRSVERLAHEEERPALAQDIEGARQPAKLPVAATIGHFRPHYTLVLIIDHY